MSNPGTWLGENAKRVLDAIQNISADGGTFTGKWIASTESTYIADGAISLADDVAILSSVAASTAMTLAAGSDGSRIIIVVSSYVNTADVDADFVGTDATATFSAAGESLELIWSTTGGGWIVVGNNGAVFS